MSLHRGQNGPSLHLGPPLRSHKRRRTPQAPYCPSAAGPINPFWPPVAACCCMACMDVPQVEHDCIPLSAALQRSEAASTGGRWVRAQEGSLADQPSMHRRTLSTSYQATRANGTCPHTYNLCMSRLAKRCQSAAPTHGPHTHLLTSPPYTPAPMRGACRCCFSSLQHSNHRPRNTFLRCSAGITTAAECHAFQHPNSQQQQRRTRTHTQHGARRIARIAHASGASVDQFAWSRARVPPLR